MRPTGNSRPVRAGIYCRISLAAEDDTVKTDDQQRICRELSAQLGWEIAEGVGLPYKDGVYTDNNKSAWQRNRNRPAWNEMLRDIEAGKINAIVVYHGDRLVRRGQDLSKLFDLAESKGVKLASPGGTHDLDRDRMMLWVRAAFAEEESQRTSERRKSQYERWRLVGRTRPGGQGGRAFGFTTDGLEHYPAVWCEIATRREFTEPAIIREMAERILSGETPYSIGRDLTGRGTTTPSGNPVTAAVVAYVLRRPRTAGLMPDGESGAAWEPVLDRETWERVRHVLDGRTAMSPGAGNARRWLLSGIALCGVCGEPLRSGRARGTKGVPGVAVYVCVAPGCRKVQRSAPHLDAYVGGRVVARLANPFNPDGRAIPVDRAAEWAVLERERAEADELLADYKASAGRTRSLTARLDQIDERMAELREDAAGSSRSRLLERYRGITREQWENDTALDVKRSLVAACFTVTVLPASARGPGFRVQDVQVEPLG